MCACAVGDDCQKQKVHLRKIYNKIDLTLRHCNDSSSSFSSVYCQTHIYIKYENKEIDPCSSQIIGLDTTKSFILAMDTKNTNNIHKTSLILSHFFFELCVTKCNSFFIYPISNGNFTLRAM